MGLQSGRAREAALARLTSRRAATSVGNWRLSRSFALPSSSRALSGTATPTLNHAPATESGPHLASKFFSSRDVSNRRCELRIQVTLRGLLNADGRAQSRMTVVLPHGATVEDLIGHLDISSSRVQIVLVNGSPAVRTKVLNNGDQVILAAPAYA